MGRENTVPYLRLVATLGSFLLLSLGWQAGAHVSLIDTSRIAGASFSSPTAIVLTSVPSTSSMDSMPTKFPTVGAAVCSSRSCFGTRTIRAYTPIMPPIIDSPRKKATGASLASLSTGGCSMYHGRAERDRSVRTIPPISLPTSGLSKTRRVSCGTTLPTTTPRKRRATLGSRTRAPLAT